MLRPARFLLLSLLTVGAARQGAAQVSALVGRVLDATTRLPVPYASLWLRTARTGTLTNAQGHFELPAPERTGPEIPDTLLVTGLGYQSNPFILHNRTLTDSTLLLKKNEPEHLVQRTELPGGQVKLHRLGSQTNKPDEGMIQGLAGSQYALLMQLPPKIRPGIIRTVAFFIGENGYPREPFRVRIYQANGPGHSPGTNLLTENVVAHAPSGGQWFTVNVSAYGITVPAEGIYVSMEWLVFAGTIYHLPTFSDGYTPDGQIMRPTFEFKDSRTWSFGFGNGWQLLTLKNAHFRSYNAMIRAEVEVLK